MVDLASLGSFLSQATADFRPPNVQKQAAAFARRCLADAIHSGFGTPQYDRYVDGRRGGFEESVNLPGRIVYVFHSWDTVLPAALTALKSSFNTGGRYADSFIVVADGKRVANYAEIPPDAEVWILNAAPYTRRLEVGRREKKSHWHHFQRAKGKLASRFGGGFGFDLVFLNVTAGLDPRIPYVLKRSNGRRKGNQAGQPITYPTLVIKAL